MKSKSSCRFRASSSSIKLNIVTCSKPPSPKRAENPREWMRNNRRRKEVKIVALLAILKSEISQQERRKKIRNQDYCKEEDVDLDWIGLAEAGYHIGIIFKRLLGGIQKRLSRATSVDGQFLLAKKHSEKLHISRLALATQLMMPAGHQDQEFKQMRKETLKMGKLYSQDKSMSIKNIFGCISSKVYGLISENCNLMILSTNKISLPHLRLAAEGFRSIVVFFNKHLNSAMVKSKFEQPQWEIFEIVGNYDKQYRNNGTIPDSAIASFFHQGFKLSVELSDRFFHYPIYQNSVDAGSFKQFIEITISLRYDLCYLERILENAKAEKEIWLKKEIAKGNIKTKTISVFKTKYTFTPSNCQNRNTRSVCIQDMMERHKICSKSSKRQENDSPRKVENKENRENKLILMPKPIRKRITGRFACQP